MTRTFDNPPTDDERCPVTTDDMTQLDEPSRCVRERDHEGNHQFSEIPDHF